jgi:hypothetical protein
VLALAVQSSQVNVSLIALALGFLIGILGHVIRSRTLIITGILVIGAVSAYFALVLPGS